MSTVRSSSLSGLDLREGPARAAASADPRVRARLRARVERFCSFVAAAHRAGVPF